MVSGKFEALQSVGLLEERTFHSTQIIFILVKIGTQPVSYAKVIPTMDVADCLAADVGGVAEDSEAL